MANITVEKVIEILNENLENIELNEALLDSDLTELGLDSLMFVQIIVALEDEFDLEIPDSKLMIGEMNTVSKIIEVLKESADE